MARSSFDGRSSVSGRQPWTAVWTPGVNLVNFFDLYDSKGDVTISAATSIPTTLDGPIQVARYGALTVNAALTASQRCRGLIVLSDSLSMGAAGSISMTARGAAGSKNWAVGKDIFVPQSITFTGRNTSYADFLKWIRQTGYCIFDPSMYACPPPGMGDVTCDWATWTPNGSTIISAAGCGARTQSGNIGNAGTAGTGGGAGGYGYDGGRAGGAGRPWGGGAAGNGPAGFDGDQYGGSAGESLSTGRFPIGGSAGNPASPGCQGTYTGTYTAGTDGTGGVLINIVRGSVTLTTGHVFVSNGSPGGNATGGNVSGTNFATGGSGSGAGAIRLYYLSTSTGTVNVSVTGGLGGTGSYGSGKAGGAGTATSTTFAAMGWAA